MGIHIRMDLGQGLPHLQSLNLAVRQQVPCGESQGAKNKHPHSGLNMGPLNAITAAFHLKQ
jgi:hypothetical protein